MDRVDRASVYAKTAACALRMVENGEVVIHCDRTVGAGAGALLTADTAVCTHLAGKSPLVVVRASDSDDSSVFHHLDGIVRTVLGAESAARAEARNDLRNAVRNDDRVVGTSRGTVAKTDAGKGTYVFAFPMLCSFFTGLKAVAEMFFVLLCSLAGTVASDISEELDSLAGFNTEDGCDLLRGGITAGNTEVGLGDLTLGECAGVAVTAAVAAGTAVCAGKSIADSKEFFVLLDSEEHVRDGKYDRADSGDRKTDKDRYDNFHQLSSLCEKILNDSRKAVERHCNDGCRDKCYGKSAEALGGVRIVEL